MGTSLEAIFLALDLRNPDVFVRQLRWRGLQPVRPSGAMWGTFFSLSANSPTGQEIVIRIVDSELGTDTISLSKNAVKPTTIRKAESADSDKDGGSAGYATTGDETPNESVRISVDRDGSEVFASFFSVRDGGYGHNVLANQPVKIRTARLLAARHTSSIEEIEQFSRLELQNKKQFFLKSVKFIDPSITDLSVVVVDKVPSLYASIDGLQERLPLALLGDGVKKATSILLGILSAPDQIVLVDEVEAGIHYSHLENLWRSIDHTCSMSNSQVIATTHSHECLLAASSAFANSDPSGLKYYRLQRNQRDRRVTAEEYSAAELQESLLANVEVR